MPLRFFPEPDTNETEIRNLTKKIADSLLRPNYIADDENSYFRKEVYQKLGSLNLISTLLSNEWGGRGYSSGCHFAVIEELARVSPAIAITVGVTNLVIGGILKFGSPEQKSKYLPELANGNLLGAFSLSEPNSGSDASSLKCAAKKTNGGYVITGSKVWCSNAGLADLTLLMARTSDDNSKGITAFLIPKDTKGFSVGKQERKLGLKASTLCEIVFEECKIPENFRLGKEGEGFTVALSQLETGRMGIAACGIGISLEVLEKAALHKLKTPSPAFSDATHHTLSQWYAELSAIKTLLAQASLEKDRGKNIRVLASQVKLLASDLSVEISSGAIDLFGMEGIATRNGIEIYLRDSKALQIVEGTNQIQKVVLAKEMEKML